MIDRLVSIHLPEIHEHFYKNNIRTEMFASEWIFGLFSSIIPLEQMADFYTQIFQNGWIFFYQLVLQLLKSHETEILKEDELYSILHNIKS